MARPEDEPGYDSACEDEYDGGVSIAEYEGSIMELDTDHQSEDPSIEPHGQETSAMGGQWPDSMPWAETLDTESECYHDTNLGPPSNAEDDISLAHPSDQIAGHEASTDEWPALASELAEPPTEVHGSIAANESTLPPNTESTLAGMQEVAQVETPPPDPPLLDNIDENINHTALNAVDNSSFDFAHPAGMADAEPEQPHHQVTDWATYHQVVGNPFGGDSFSSFDTSNNMSFVECYRFWRDAHRTLQPTPWRNPGPKKGPEACFFPSLMHDVLPIERPHWKPRMVVTRSAVEKKKYDIQGMDWGTGAPSNDVTHELRRRSYGQVRQRTYLNLVNVDLSHHHRQKFNGWDMFCAAPYMNEKGREKASIIPRTEEYFHFSRMNLQHEISIPHFQLRHIISASSTNAVFYPTLMDDQTGSHITRVNTSVADDDLIIDSANCGRHSNTPRMQKIFTLSATNDVLIAGGLNGEYATKSLSTPPNTPFTSGTVTFSPLSSTNHVHTHLDRRSGLPHAIFSSNDNRTHTLDCTTNTFLAHHNHAKPVNCAATSPDTRLRLLARDALHPLVVEADTGKRIAKLSGHSDYAFAAAWSPDAVHMATAAQDGLVHIYDMRARRAPLQTLATDLGGVRALAFSPLGSGPPVLLMAESADFVHVVDAVGFGKMQTVDFFGEVAGVCFEPEGNKFWIGIGDPDVGGLMEFERNVEGGGEDGVGKYRVGKSRRWVDEEEEEEEEEKE